jgi:hypothetical protein
MSGDIITTSAAAIGVAGYLGGELFKPTLEAMGGSVRDFLTARVRKVFTRTEEKISASDLGPPVPPGFLALFIQRASFAEDEDEITELWANLLADAAGAFSNKHVNYVDILSQLGPAEVGLLNQLVGQDHAWGHDRPSNLHSSVGILLGNEIAAGARTPEEATAAVSRVLQAKPYWPGAVLSAEMPYSSGNDVATAVGGSGRQDWETIAIDILIRQRLLEEVTVELRAWEPPPRARVILVTSLGMDFVQVCRGVDPSR